jgi:RimJ/RimL family protein N-acetyltransferase
LSGPEANSGGLLLRPAVLEDAELLRQWRNDPATRAASHNMAEIGEEEHWQWLLRQLADPCCRLFVAEENGVPVGTARANWQKDVWLLSWVTAPEARGRGVAKRMIALLLHQLAEPVRAEVKVGNVVSARLAEQVGMVLEREEDGVLYYRKEMLG